MRTELWRRAKGIFEQAVELSPAAREHCLDAECGGDEELRQAVEGLLAADLGDRPLAAEESAAELTRALEQTADRHWLDRSLGAYRIVSKLGQGGMGSVFLAERADAEFDKQVAIKVLPLWTSSPENLRRFRQERQILAMLEHPDIARLLDGGTTAEGLPYLVMEYVDGLPVTAYCDQQRLTVRRRLELFARICDAVSYAHRNLVVHRDLKAHNILVTAAGAPKLLDFGIAKLLDTEAGELTVQRMLTPDYASPEQLAGRPITTAADVYSLGILLFELLAGRRPFSFVGRSLRQIEDTLNTRPPPPSALVAGRTERQDGTEVARRRGTRPRVLRRQLAGDLDNVVLRALRSDPARRYPSASALADDLRRFLTGLPVAARPAGRFYRLIKFVRRHALATAAALAVAALTAGFVVTTTLQSRELARERDHARREQARAEHVARLLVESFELADPSRNRGEQVTAREILATGARRVSQELADEPLLEATMLYTIGKVHTRLGLYQQARRLLEKSLAIRRNLLAEDHPQAIESRHELAYLLLGQGDLAAAEEEARRALESRRRTGSPQTAESLHLLAEIRRGQGDRRQAIGLHEEALEIQRATLGTHQLEYVRGLSLLARSLRLHGDKERAEALYRQALDIQRDRDREVHPVTGEVLNELARMSEAREDLEAAEALARQALELNRTLYGEEHPAIAVSLGILANVERRHGRLEQAGVLYRQVLAMHRKLLGPQHPRLAAAIYNLALFEHYDLPRLAAAEALYREAIEVFSSAVGREHVNMGFFVLGHGSVLNDLGRPREAEPVLRQALDLFTRLSRGGAGGRNAAMAKSELGGALLAMDRHAAAEALLRDSYPVLSEHLGEDDQLRRRAGGYLTRLYRETGRSDQAVALP